MTDRLAKLKAAHPEWCFRCGYHESEPLELREGGCVFCDGVNNPVIAALVAALEDEEELRLKAEAGWDQASNFLKQAKVENDSLRAQLTAPSQGPQPPDLGLADLLREGRMIENFITERRIGNFHVRRSLLEENPEEVLGFFSNFLVVRAECIYAEDLIEYTAFSPLFEPVPLNARPPLYMIEMVSVALDPPEGGRIYQSRISGVRRVK